MIKAPHFEGLAQAIRNATISSGATRLTFKVDTHHLTAWPVSRRPAEVPMMTSDGGATDLARLLDAFSHWSRPVMLGTHYQGGLFEFWIESDET